MQKRQKERLKGLVFAALFAALTAAVSPIKIPLGFTPVPITLQTLMVLLSGALLGSKLGALSQFLYILVGALGLPVFAGGGSGFGALLGPTGGYLFSYPIASFVVGKMLEKKKLTAFLRYSSFIIIIAFIIIISSDLILNAGIMNQWDKSSNSYVPIVSLLSESQRMILIIVCAVLLLGLISIVLYLRGNKMIPADTVLAMFAGTLIIYILGSIQGKLVTGLGWSAIFVGWVLPFIVGDTIKLLLAAYISRAIHMKKYLK